MDFIIIGSVTTAVRVTAFGLIDLRRPHLHKRLGERPRPRLARRTECDSQHDYRLKLVTLVEICVSQRNDLALNEKNMVWLSPRRHSRLRRYVVREGSKTDGASRPYFGRSAPSTNIQAIIRLSTWHLGNYGPNTNPREPTPCRELRFTGTTS
jgi:hypothetical protein